jgi:hypothetical protein
MPSALYPSKNKKSSLIPIVSALALSPASRVYPWREETEAGRKTGKEGVSGGW